MTRQAMFNRYAMNAKRVSEKKMFDAEKARKRLEKGSRNWKDSKDVTSRQRQYRQMKKALKGFKPKFKSH